MNVLHLLVFPHPKNGPPLKMTTPEELGGYWWILKQPTVGLVMHTQAVCKCGNYGETSRIITTWN